MEEEEEEEAAIDAVLSRTYAICCVTRTTLGCRVDVSLAVQIVRAYADWMSNTSRVIPKREFPMDCFRFAHKVPILVEHLPTRATIVDPSEFQPF